MTVRLGDDDIIVTGIRGGIAAQNEAKRKSSVIADIVSAQDIGKFPDKNVAEALQRVPGIVINREFGEGERVSLRGTAPNLTKTLVNGPRHRDCRLVHPSTSSPRPVVQLSDVAGRDRWAA